jgi:hypothetical protein
LYYRVKSVGKFNNGEEVVVSYLKEPFRLPRGGNEGNLQLGQCPVEAQTGHLTNITQKNNFKVKIRQHNCTSHKLARCDHQHQ